MLKIIVCVKAVPDPALADKTRINPETGNLIRGDLPLVINPLDRNALEAALELKSEFGAHITALSMGPPNADAVVKEACALGADEGILLSDPAFAGADAFATAYTLAKAVEKIGAMDVVFCGMASSDGATEWVGPEMAVFLDCPVATFVEEITPIDDGIWNLRTSLAQGHRLMQVRLPAVLTVTRELNTPRSLSFSGIIKARKKVITVWDLEALGLAPESVGLDGSPTIVSGMRTVESKRDVTFLDGNSEEKAAALVDMLVDTGVL